MLLWGGTAGVAYDPCYHQACDDIDNLSLEALDINADAIAYAVLNYAMNTEPINGVPGKGNFRATGVEDELAVDLGTATPLGVQLPTPRRSSGRSRHQVPGRRDLGPWSSAPATVELDVST